MTKKPRREPSCSPLLENVAAMWEGMTPGQRDRCRAMFKQSMSTGDPVNAALYGDINQNDQDRPPLMWLYTVIYCRVRLQ